MKINSGRSAGRIKPKPLIFAPEHKNIATLIAFLMTIFVGLGAGWLAGSVLSGGPDPTPVVQAQVAPKAEETTPVDPIGDADEVKRPATQQPIVEEDDDKAEPRTRAQRRASSRRAYATAQAGEPIPVAVIKGKPIKKAFRQFKKVRIW